MTALTLRAARTRSAGLVLGVMLACFAVTACGSGSGRAGHGTSSRFAGVALAQPAPKPEFVLTDTAGRPFDFAAQTKGDLTLLYFGYTHCPDICPVHMAQIASVLRDDPIANVKVVFVTVDPARDTPEHLRGWLDNFSHDFIGLTGTPAEIKAAEEAAGVPEAIAYDDGTFGHAAQVMAFAPNGLGYTVYPFGTRQSQYAHDLPLLAAMTRPTADSGART